MPGSIGAGALICGLVRVPLREAPYALIA